MSNSNQIKKFYNKSTDIYLQSIGYYIFGCYPPDDFNLIEYLKNILEIKPGNKVLDAGCGTGKMLIDLWALEKEAEFYGVTVSERQLQIANELIQTHSISNVHVFLQDFHHLSNRFEPDFFDAVYFNEALFHSSSIKKVINETYNVLKPGGIFYAKDIYVNKFRYLLPILGGINYKTIQAIRNNYLYYPKYPLFVKNILESSGFKLLKFSPPPYTPVFQKMIDFEKAYNIKVYELVSKSHATHWREILAVKI